MFGLSTKFDYQIHNGKQNRPKPENPGNGTSQAYQTHPNKLKQDKKKSNPTKVT